MTESVGLTLMPTMPTHKPTHVFRHSRHTRAPCTHSLGISTRPSLTSLTQSFSHSFTNITIAFGIVGNDHYHVVDMVEVSLKVVWW